MSSQITEAFVKQFGANIMHLSQQKGSRLKPAVRTETVNGDARFFERLGSTTAQLRVSRHGDTPQVDSQHSRRMVTLKSYEWGDLIDKADKVRLLIDPTNEYSMAAQWAMGRAMDTEIITAASGNAYGGVAGATPVALPSTQKVAASTGAAGTSLNVFALRKATYILDRNEVDQMEARFMAFNAYQKNALLGETQVTSADYASVKALVQGQIDSFMGFKFLHTELLVEQVGTLQFSAVTGEVDGAGFSSDGYDKLVAWAKSGLLLGIGADITAKIAERADKSFSTQVYASMDIGATRMEEEKVVEVHCKDT